MMKTFFYNGLKIRYKIAGKGQPFLFLHNGGGIHQVWDYQFDYFKNNFQVISFDFLGFGQSDSLDNCHIDIHVKYLEAFIKENHLTNINIAGVCMGASVALKLSNLMPQNIDNLFLFNICPGRRFIGPTLFQRLYLKFSQNDFLVNLTYKFFDRLAPLYLKFAPLPDILFHQNIDKKNSYYQTLKKQYRKRSHLQSRLRMYRYIHSYTVEDYLSKNMIKNTYILWGEKNRIVPLDEGYYLNNLIKAKKFYTITQTGHLPFGERADYVNQILEHHLLKK